MRFGLTASWPSRCRSLALLAAAFVAFLVARPALASRSIFRTYDSAQGLTSLGGACMLQDQAGFILDCTEHGVFAYDGRRFVNLGPEQGLRQGGVVYGLALLPDGRLAVGFADEVYLSDRASDSSHPPSSLKFVGIGHPGLTFYSERPHRFAVWRNGIALLTGAETLRADGSGATPARLEPMQYGPAEKAVLKGASSIFVVRGHLWEAFDDGRLCKADPGAVRCYNSADGLPAGPWGDITAGPHGSVLARSPVSVASQAAGSDSWTVTELPDQNGRYVNYNPDLQIFRAPNGGLITQADHGLAVLEPKGWRLLTVEDGAPSGTIVSAMTDATGQLWFQILGRGLVRWVGYGHWETFQKTDGLSDGIPWQTVRGPGGALYVSTDTGVDEIVRQGSTLRTSRVMPHAAFAIAMGPRGELWRGYGIDGAQVVDLASGAAAKIDVPPVESIVASGNDLIWLGTQAGLYKVDDRAGQKRRPVLDGSPRSEVGAIVCDGIGGAYYLAGGRLRHRKADGSDIAVEGPWPGNGFEPLALALDHRGRVWIGGAGGLFSFILAGDRIVGFEAVPTEDTRTNSVVAVMVDHRGWVWAGTALGVSVFNQERWVSVDADSGLASDDVDQGGLREDPDGSIWIVTTQGLSHLLDPDWLFADQPLKAVVSGAVLGSRTLAAGTIPYTREALSFQFGTPNDGAERSFLFRYNLSGVDTDWVESSSGAVRYPFVPPGHHVLKLIGVDELTHRTSDAATLPIDMAYPWWRQWWAEALWTLCGAGLIYGAMRLRFRAMLARQAELKRYVIEATEQLQYQAAHDALTGLLNRCEIERRLATKLSGGRVSEEMVVAMIDIDHFKRINDTFGHLGGDDVLRGVGRMVSRVLRPTEYAGRYGGEEILLVLDDSDGRGTARVLDLHHALRAAAFNAAGNAMRLTCSIGLAWARRGDSWESLIGRADEALYKAKAAGRDRVVESGRINPDVRGVANERRVRRSA